MAGAQSQPGKAEQSGAGDAAGGLQANGRHPHGQQPPLLTAGSNDAAMTPPQLMAAVSAPAQLPAVDKPAADAPKVAETAAAEHAVADQASTPTKAAAPNGFAFAETVGSATPAQIGKPAKLPQPLGNPAVKRLLVHLQETDDPASPAAAPAENGGEAAAQQQQQQQQQSSAAADGYTAPSGQARPSAVPGLPSLRAPAPKAVAFSPGALQPPSMLPQQHGGPATPLHVLRGGSGTLALQGGSGGGTAAAMQQPLAFMEGLLARIVSLDTEQYFELPVDEAEAPGYHNFVKQPMCWSDMRRKLQSRRYRTWRAFVDDFQLVCQNAMTFNQQRSRLHRAAINILRTGSKLLQEEDQHGRLAIAALHPDGPRAATANARRERGSPASFSPGVDAAVLHSAGTPLGIPSPLAAATPTPPPVAPSAAVTPSAAATAGHRTTSLADTTTTPEASDGGGNGLYLDPFDTDEEGYSSFSDAAPDPLPPGRFPASVPASAGAGLAPSAKPAADATPGDDAFWGVGRQLPHAPDLATLLSGLSERVLRVPWPAAGSDSAAAVAAGSSAVAADGDGAAAATKGARAATDVNAAAGWTGSRKRSKAWKQARRTIEWRARWLSLRLQELGHQRTRHEAALAELQARQQLLMDAAAMPPPAATAQQAAAAPAVAAAVPSAAAASQPPPAVNGPTASAVHPAQAAAAMGSAPAADALQPPTPGNGSESKAAVLPPPLLPPPKARRQRLHHPDLAPQQLLHHPWIGAHAAAGQLPTLDATDYTAAASDDDDVWFPGRGYALLDLIERQRAFARQITASMCQMQDPDAAQAARKSSGMSRGRGGCGQARPGSARLRGPPQKTMSGKRRRGDEFPEPGTPLLTGTGIGAPKFVERQQAMEIPLPQVRRLASGELSARRSAIAAWRQRFKAGGASGDVAAAAAAAGGSVDLKSDASAVSSDAADATASSSSEEDSGDEAFLARHRPLEAEERQRFLTYSSGGVPGSMKARAKGGGGGNKFKPGGNPRSAGGSRPDSAPARTATAPPALMAPPAARPAGGRPSVSPRAGGDPGGVSPQAGTADAGSGAAAAANDARGGPATRGGAASSMETGGGGTTRRNSGSTRRASGGEKRGRGRPPSAGSAKPASGRSGGSRSPSLATGNAAAGNAAAGDSAAAAHEHNAAAASLAKAAQQQTPDAAAAARAAASAMQLDKGR